MFAVLKVVTSLLHSGGTSTAASSDGTPPVSDVLPVSHSTVHGNY